MRQVAAVVGGARNPGGRVCAAKPESALSPGEARRLQEVRFPDGVLVQFSQPSLSVYSYLLCSGGEALLVDPTRDIRVFERYLSELKLKLNGVFLTHSHADFVAGHLEAAHRFDVPVFISAAAGAKYRHQALHDGDTLCIGALTLRFLETPGHTLDGMCVLVESGGLPQLLLTGDTLFAGSVGRPDLMGAVASAAELAGAAYDSWRNQLSRLPDELPFYPAHGAGSLCGAHLRDEPSSTIGRERRDNPYLQVGSRNEFIRNIIADLPPAPGYFGYDAELNRRGPALVDWDAPVQNCKPSVDLADSGKFAVIDLREVAAYTAGHVPNSLNLPLSGHLETWCGTLISPNESLVMIASEPEELAEALSRLEGIGYCAVGMLWSDYAAASLPVKTVDVLSARELADLIAAGREPVVLDVRQPAEYRRERIGDFLNLPLGQLRREAGKLERAPMTVTVCASGYRASAALGLLEREGFSHLATLSGGTAAWVEAGFPVTRTESQSASPASASRVLPLPDRIGVEELWGWLQDLPGSFELVDLRPAADFARDALPGAINVEPADVIFGERWRQGRNPIILLDRDGTIAMAIGGILAKESARPIKVVCGGMAAIRYARKNGEE